MPYFKGQVRQLSEQERFDWLRLFRSENVGAITFMQLMARYKTAAKALEMIPELATRGGKKRRLKVADEATVRKELKALKKAGGQLIALCEPAYPTCLRAIDDPPPVLQAIGHVHLLEKPSIAIVGARNASLNGRNFARRLATDLATAGYPIVSGLARGIDAAAHQGSLTAGTIAVLGGGVDVIYPRENTDLYREVAKHGLLLSEAPFGTAPQARHFPKRNRIVSGLSQAIIVVEAAQRSGSLITARMALEQGREVMAVPGSPLDPRCHGTNRLIRDGATLIENAEQVIQQLKSQGHEGFAERKDGQDDLFGGFDEPESGGPDDLQMATLRRDVLSLLSPSPSPINDIVRALSQPARVVQSILLELELAGLAQRLAGNRVMLIDVTGFAEDEADSPGLGTRLSLFD